MIHVQVIIRFPGLLHLPIVTPVEVTKMKISMSVEVLIKDGTFIQMDGKLELHIFYQHLEIDKTDKQIMLAVQEITSFQPVKIMIELGNYILCQEELLLLMYMEVPLQEMCLETGIRRI